MSTLGPMTTPSLTDAAGNVYEVVQSNGTDESGVACLKPGDLIVRRKPAGGEDDEVLRLFAQTCDTTSPRFKEFNAALNADRARIRAETIEEMRRA